MGKGGGSSNQTSTVYQSNLPQYARPFYESLMERAQTESTRPYQPYGGQRNAGMSDMTKQGLTMASAFANSGSNDLNNARSLAELVGQQAIGYQNYKAGGVDNTYQGPAAWQNGQFNPDQVKFGGDLSKINASEFDAAARDKYMSPYMDSVVEASQADAQSKALQEQAYLKTEAAKAGAFGGSRGAVQQQIALNDAQKRIADIGVQGRQAAFENAQQQFERDRTAGMNAQQSNQSAALQMALANQAKNLEAMGMGEQSRQFGYQQTEQGRQRAAELGMNAQQLTEQLRQSGQQLGLQGLQIANQTSNQLADYQKLNDSMMLQRIQAQLGIGQTQEDYRQKELDTGYEDFVNQRDANRQNLGWLSSILQGVPISNNQNVTQTVPNNNVQGAIGTMAGIQALQSLGRQQT